MSLLLYVLLYWNNKFLQKKGSGWCHCPSLPLGFWGTKDGEQSARCLWIWTNAVSSNSCSSKGKICSAPPLTPLGPSCNTCPPTSHQPKRVLQAHYYHRAPFERCTSSRDSLLPPKVFFFLNLLTICLPILIIHVYIFFINSRFVIEFDNEVKTIGKTKYFVVDPFSKN